MQLLTAQDWAGFVDLLDLTGPLSVDLETNGKPVLNPESRIVGLSAAGFSPSGALVSANVPLTFQQGVNADQMIVPAIALTLSERDLIAYSMANEIAWLLAKWGARYRWVGDPLIAELLLSGRFMPLKELAHERLGGEWPALASLVGAHTFDFSTLDPQDPNVTQYMENDALAPLRLYGRQRIELIDQGLWGVYGLELAVGAVMAEQYAYPVNLDMLSEIFIEAQHERERLEPEIFELLGGKCLLGSPRVLTEKLQALGIQSPRRTSLGAPSWDAEALQMMAPFHPVIPLLQAHRLALKISSSAQALLHQTETSGGLHVHWWTLNDTGAAMSGSPLSTLHGALRPAFQEAGVQWYRGRLDRAYPHAWAELLEDPVMLEAFPEHVLRTWVYGGHNPAYVDRKLGEGGPGWMQAIEQRVSPGGRERLRLLRQAAIDRMMIRGEMNRLTRTRPTDDLFEQQKRLLVALSQDYVWTKLKIFLLSFGGMEWPKIRRHLLRQVIAIDDTIWLSFREPIPAEALHQWASAAVRAVMVPVEWTGPYKSWACDVVDLLE